MKKLLKEYNLKNEYEYYCMICDSFTNGQIQQAKDQFKAMPQANRKDMVKQAHDLLLPEGRINQLIDLI